MITPSVRDAAHVALRGRSAGRGRSPGWLAAASDIRFVGCSGDRDTELHFESLRLGDAAPELYVQQEFWAARPDASWTGLDLLAAAVADVQGANAEESDRFDTPLLREIGFFNRAFKEGFQEITLPSQHSGAGVPLTAETLARAASLRETTPKPKRVRVVGTLDMIRVSRQMLGLRLDGGEEVRGVLVAESVVNLRDLLERRVAVLGKAIFRPSGRLLRIDIEGVEPGDGLSDFWSRVPKPDLALSRGTRTRTTEGLPGVSGFFGTWPGDESEEELLAALRAL